ncbi:MAG: putative beta-lysine N-acetyltransferase [Thermodesulfobacteriota bacterium]|nr:putative beta-lysine N-acetyltransferase [Thermodesulfobacteriota bacterium]
MPDIIEDIKGSIIQHGLHNDRIYLMQLNTDDTHGLIATLNDMALKNGYGKIFGKIPASVWKDFKSADYVKEAVVPRFFLGKTDGFFIAKYFSAKRQRAQDAETLLRLVNNAGRGIANKKPRTDRTVRDVVSCKPSDAEEMSTIYRQVFSSYPFPIHQPTYLQRMLKEGVLYFCIRMQGRIAAIAAVEINLINKNAEMTDFATLPKWRSMGFADTLLRYMDNKARKLGIITAYTIARAESHGMNSVFKNNGYNYSGLLKNNSQICGSIQSMTVWYKHL